MAGPGRQAPEGQREPWQKTRKWCARILAGLLICFLILLAALGGAYWFLNRDPQALAKNSLEELEKATGLKCGFGTVIVNLLPLPSIAIYDLQIQGPDADLSIALALARPAPGDLIRGRFMPASLELFRPVFTARVATRLDQPDALLDLAQKIPSPPGGARKEGKPPNLPDKISLSIRNGRIRVRGEDRTGIFGRNLHADLDFSKGRHFDCKLEMARLRLFHQRKPVFALERLRVAGNMRNNIPEAAEFSTALSMPGWLQNGRLNLSLSKNGETGWKLEPDFSADFTPGQASMPIALSGSISSLDKGIVTFSGMKIQMDADSGQLDMLLKTGPELKDWQAQGSLAIQRVSLTQWLGFARNLPPGLQLSLDNISRGRMEFLLDAKSLKVPSIIASCAGATFSGSGGVDDFARPVVMLDLQAPKVNLGLALPEALAKTPDPPKFPFAPLTPMPGEPLKEGETGVNYDIRLAADSLFYGPLTLQNASLRIYPGALDKPLMLEDVLLDASAKLGGGKLSASCILGADPSLPCNISATASGISANALARQWKDFPLAKGTLSAKANVFSKGKALGVFLANLNGPINVSGTNVALPSGFKTTFTKLELGSRLKSGRLEKNGASFDGQWQVAANCDPGDIKGDANGRVQFDANGLGLNGLAASANITLRKAAEFLPPTLPLSVKGIVSGRSHEAIYTFQKLELDALGAHFSGNATFNAKKLSCAGKATVDSPDLADSLKKLGIKNPSLPGPMRKLNAQADFTVQTDKLRLEKLSASFNGLKLAGTLEATKKAVPDINFNLTANAIDLQDFQGKAPSRPGEKWNFNALRNFNATGNLRVASLTGFGLRFSNLEIPLKLNSGKLDAGPARATFCGARVESSVKAEFNQALLFTSVFSAHSFNLGEAARQRKIEGALEGEASIDANLRGKLTGPDQLIKNLNGNWKVIIKNASWQSLGKNGKLEGKPTKFNLVSASGSLGQAVLRSDNLYLRGQDMIASGKGWMNLEKNTIDSTLNVNMKNMPDFPLYIYGPVAKPTTSIGAGKLVLNAIGGFTSGVANILGGMFDGVVNIFK